MFAHYHNFMFNDFLLIFFWWLLLAGIGLIFLPLTFRLFKNFFDKGYLFSKILGILLISYLVWLLGSLKILPFLNETIWLVILGVAGFNWWLFNKNQTDLKQELKKNWRIFVGEEVIFFVCLVFWSLIRGFQPDIQGLEKFMDYGFVNSILRSSYFPPKDMWLAGETINYYYFGHLVSAVLTKLSGIDSAITYNLLMASLFAFTFGLGFSLAGNFFYFHSKTKKINRRLIGVGLLGTFLLTLGGNLHPLYWFIKHGNFQAYWYPDATRFIVELFGATDNTIHEFPIYSFVVADLHGHILNLPGVLLFLALILVIFSATKIAWYFYLLPSLLLGIFYMTNAWDFAIYNLLFGLAILLPNYLKDNISLKTVVQTAKVVLPVFIGSLIFSLPFHLNFKNLTGGVDLTDFHSPPWMLLVLWGFPLIISLSFGVLVKFSRYRLRKVDLLILMMIAISWFLIVFPEFLYLKDIYIHSYQRANTMFKLTYQSFVMFALVSGYILSQVFASLKRTRRLKIFLFPVYFILLLAVLIYPYFAVRSYYGLKEYRGLYGLDFLKLSYPDDYRAILWLRKNLSGQPVIVEAVGESYTDFARVSAHTGLPTILGWRVHEWLWRGSFDEAGKRTEEVREIYEETDLAKTKTLLNQYQAKYIFVGDLERQTYSHLQEEKLATLGETVFAAGETKVYRLN
jgi:uncharacterized membrane protein